MARNLQWDDVRYFLETARQGTLSGAAKRLGVEHSTVARRIGALEAALGVRLFDRLPRVWQLTSEGETLATQARHLEDEALTFARIASGASALEGTVRISAPPVLASHFLVPRLASLYEAWPAVNLEMIGETREADLMRGEADLALRFSRPSAPGLAARPLGDVAFGLYAARTYAERPQESWEFLGYDDSLSRTPQQMWLDKVAAERRFILRSNDLNALHQGARAGLGVAVLPHFLAQADMALVLVGGRRACPVKRRLWMTIHPDVSRSPRVRAVADALIDIVSKEQSLFT